MGFIFLCVFFWDNSLCDIYLASYSRDAHELDVGLHGNCPLQFSDFNQNCNISSNFSDTLHYNILWKYVLGVLNFYRQIRPTCWPTYLKLFVTNGMKLDVLIHEGMGTCRMKCCWDFQTVLIYRTNLGRLSWYEIAIHTFSDRMLWSSEATLRKGTDSNDWKRQEFWKRNNWNEDVEKR